MARCNKNKKDEDQNDWAGEKVQAVRPAPPLFAKRCRPRSAYGLLWTPLTLVAHGYAREFCKNG